MRIVALVLALCLLSRTAAAACAEDDNDCLLKLVLQQTYELEAAQKRNAILQKNLEEEVARADNGPKFFVCGMLAGIVFVGLGATIAMKAISLGKK